MMEGDSMTPSRRGIVGWLLGGGIVASIVSFVYPVIRFIMPPDVAEAAVDQVSAGKIGDLKPNSAKIVKFGTKPVILVRTSDTEWKAFSAVCTHLNCTVQYKSDAKSIWCACHNGLYDLTGKVISGPPPRSLEEYQVHVAGEEVVIVRRA